jgi:penicillin-binding protein 1A
MRAGPDTQKPILEAFKPGTAPPDSYSVVGFDNGQGQGQYSGQGQYQGQRDPNSGQGGAPPPGFFGQRGVSPESGRAVRSGTGGLY